jgi:hypothetical protein
MTQSAPQEQGGTQLQADKRFFDNGDGTVTDRQTGLMWKQTDAFQDLQKWTNWFDALAYVKDLNVKKFAGYDDWRMPMLKEAQAIYTADRFIRDMDRFEIYIDSAFSPGGGYTTWTNSTRPNGCAAIFYYRYGHENVNHKEDISRDTVRAVRNIAKP